MEKFIRKWNYKSIDAVYVFDWKLLIQENKEKQDVRIWFH